MPLDAETNYYYAYPGDIRKCRALSPMRDTTLKITHIHNYYGLTTAEQWWKERFWTLRNRGYMLRCRIRHRWKPSWTYSDIPEYFEDSFIHSHKQVMDAMHLKSGTTVVFKSVKFSSQEIQILEFLSDPEFRKEPTNHAVPLLDHFYDNDDPTTYYLAMPLLRPFNDPPFSAVSEVVDFLRQTLEGLEFLHKHGIAHRNCCERHILMDGASLYRNGFHPVRKDLDNDLRIAKPLRRLDVGPAIKYYFVDFSLSSHFSNDKQSRLVTGDQSDEPNIPELSEDIPYDPFPVDVFALGKVYSRALSKRYANMFPFTSLFDAMTEREPSVRPTPSQAIVLLNAVVDTVEMRKRLHTIGESLIMRPLFDATFAASNILSQTKSLLQLSSRSK